MEIYCTIQYYYKLKDDSIYNIFNNQLLTFSIELKMDKILLKKFILHLETNKNPFSGIYWSRNINLITIDNVTEALSLPLPLPLILLVRFKN